CSRHLRWRTQKMTGTRLRSHSGATMKRIRLTSLIPRLAVCLLVFGASAAQAQTTPTDSAAYVQRGNAWFAKGDLERAIADYNIAIAFGHNAATPYYNRGCLRQAKGDIEGALADYNRAIEINPRYASAYNNRGGLYYSQGRLDEAIAEANRALAIDPRHA